MKKAVFFFVPLIVGLIFQISCLNTKNSKEIEKIDEMILVLENMEDTLNAVDLDSVLRSYDRVATRTHGLQTLVSQLPSSSDLKIKMKLHGDIHKIFQKYPKKHKELLKDIVERKEYLKKLKNDVDILDKDSLLTYIRFEENEVMNLKKNYDIVYGNLVRHFALEKEVAPVINNFIDSLFQAAKSGRKI
ncbi:MAG: hypothetical protein JXR58_00690 [Bacteroidales bacterium]|nr:hypothetical protein [Bacteroidales bacterium]